MKTRAKTVKQARLVLEDGSEFSGYSFGKARSHAGEVVFYTGMGGYPQVLTDPAFRGQILVSTYPLIGNTGVPVKTKTCEPFSDSQGLPLHLESSQIQVSGLVVSEACFAPSHFSSGAALPAWLEKCNTPGVYGIDTRALARRLRDSGAMQGKILVEGSRDPTMESGLIANPVAEVSCQAPQSYGPGNITDDAPAKIALIDCGVKAGLIRRLLRMNVEITLLPWNHDLKGFPYDGLMLCGGPGDPKACGKTIATVRRAFDLKKPIFGTGLGSLVMALAAGADTYKLPNGHRGQGQPCIEAGTKRCYITSQNHGYAVRAESLPRGWAPWFINANDDTIEGIRCENGPFRGVQFNPEGSPGPGDTGYLLENFMDEVDIARGKKKSTTSR